jgi:hypothetical protein
VVVEAVVRHSHMQDQALAYTMGQLASMLQEPALPACEPMPR